jgi:hypothetical protein
MPSFTPITTLPPITPEESARRKKVEEEETAKTFESSPVNDFVDKITDAVITNLDRGAFKMQVPNNEYATKLVDIVNNNPFFLHYGEKFFHVEFEKTGEKMYIVLSWEIAKNESFENAKEITYEVFIRNAFISSLKKERGFLMFDTGPGGADIQTLIELRELLKESGGLEYYNLKLRKFKNRIVIAVTKKESGPTPYEIKAGEIVSKFEEKKTEANQTRQKVRWVFESGRDFTLAHTILMGFYNVQGYTASFLRETDTDNVMNIYPDDGTAS